MTKAIAWIFEALLRLVLPPSGRHRATDTANGRPTGWHQHAPTCEWQQRLERAEYRLARQRRRALRLAVHGVDVGPRLIHGVKVAA
ncbi:hypothetical protein ACFV2X_45230 [Streptomyces sp. NPDC059679]|uniref:hypothetical protein n=1 Tax=Streptomyces sp. NPDC059679 TaxID=3346903 RepID=UPI00368C82E7